MENCNSKNYNKFEAVDSATKVIVDYLVNNNEDLWKLLKYIKPNDLPLSHENLTYKEKVDMICTDTYEVNNNVDKNILFQIVSDEAFSTAIPQLRIEIGEIVPVDSYRGYITIDFQIVVPNKQDIFIAPYSNVARRSIAIFRELVKTLNGVYIPKSKFYSEMFMNKSANGGAGRSTGSFRQQMNNSYTGRICTFAVWLGAM